MTPTDDLQALEARLARIEDHLARLTTLLARVPDPDPTLAMAGDVFDAWAAEQQRRGVDLDGHVATAARLAERLTDPRVAQKLESLAELAPKLLAVAEVAATFEPSTAMLGDVFDEWVRRLDARGVDFEARIRGAARLVERLTDPALQAGLEDLLDLAPTLATYRPLGVFGLLRALGHPDVQRAAGLAVALAARLGRHLPAPASVPAPRSR